MRQTALRILKHGLPVAVALLALGYVLAEGAAMWVAAQPPPRPSRSANGVPAPAPAPADDVGRQLRTRMPFALAGWGFGLVAAFEVLLAVWRRGTPSPAAAPKPAAVPSEDETERLLNELLRQAEAAEAARNRAALPSPPADAAVPASGSR